MKILKEVGTNFIQSPIENSKGHEFAYQGAQYYSSGTCLIKKYEDKEVKLQLSLSTHLRIMCVLRKICFFTVNPTKEQCSTMEKLSFILCKSPNVQSLYSEDSIEEAINAVQVSRAQRLVLKEFISINQKLIFFHAELTRLTSKTVTNKQNSK